MAEVIAINEADEKRDKRLSMIRRCLHNGLSPYDIIQRCDRAQCFPTTYGYFQKSTLIKEEIDKIRKEERERIKSEEQNVEDGKLDHIARLEFLYQTAVQQGDIPNARNVLKDLAIAKGISVDQQAAGGFGDIADALREASRLGREMFLKGKEQPASIDVTPQVAEGEIVKYDIDNYSNNANLPVPIETKHAGVSLSPALRSLLKKKKHALD